MMFVVSGSWYQHCNKHRQTCRVLNWVVQVWLREWMVCVVFEFAAVVDGDDGDGADDGGGDGDGGGGGGGGGRDPYFEILIQH